MRSAPRRSCGRRRNLSGKRFSAWLSHTSISEQETPRPLLTAGEILQLPQDDALVLVSGVPPIRASKLKYYADRNFLARRLPAPKLAAGRYADVPPPRRDDWSGQTRGTHARLDKAWSELVTVEPARRRRARRAPARSPRRKKDKGERPLSDLPLFARAPVRPRAGRATQRLPMTTATRSSSFRGCAC